MARTLFHREATTDARLVYTHGTDICRGMREPATGPWRVVSWSFINYSNAAATVTVYIMPPKNARPPGTADTLDDEWIVYGAVSIPANTTTTDETDLSIEGGWIIDRGDTVWIKAGTANSINVRATGSAHNV